MRSYIFSNGEWIPTPSDKSSGSREFMPLSNLAGLRYHRMQYILYSRIKSCNDYNSYVTSMTRALAGSSRSTPFFRSFCNSPIMINDIFNPNLVKKRTQLYCFNNAKPGLLICFCGSANALNIPISVFHASYSQLFGSVAYVVWQDFHQILNNIESVFETVPAFENLYFLGTSHGAYIPLLMKSRYPDSRGLSFSPANLHLLRCYKALYAGINPRYSFLNYLFGRGLRVYYSKSQARDNQFAITCKSMMDPNVFSDVFNDISYIHDRHATLYTLHEHGSLGRTMHEFVQNKF